MVVTQADHGIVVVLNGPPRSGKSSIASEVVATFDGDWVNLGVDSTMARTPTELLPALGLRPGGERPDLEPLVLQQYRELFAEVAQSASCAVNVVMDVGIHDDYSTPLSLASELATAFAGLEVLCVGVHCSLEELRIRRAATGYLSWPVSGVVPPPVQRWQRAVHTQLAYDIEVDTSVLSASECAAALRPLLDARR